MELTGFYSQAATQTQPVSSPASPANDTSQAPAPRMAASPAIAVSWVGILIALVALRLVYEVSD